MGGVADTQNVWTTAERILDAGFPLSGRYVNVGAHDGQADDPIYDYARRTNATGVAVERDPDRCASHRRALPAVNVQCSEVTPQNVLSLLAAGGVTAQSNDGELLDVLRVDIDSYDCPVVEVLLEAGIA